MKKILILGCLLIGIMCQAQIKNFSIQAGANYPLIKDVEKKVETIFLPIPSSTGYTTISTGVTGGIKESFSSSVGYQIGGQFDYSLGSNFFLTSGLSINYLRFQRSVTVSDLTLAVEQPVRVPTTVGQPFGAIYGGFTLRDVNGDVVLTDPRVPNRSENYGNTTSLSVQLPVLVGTSFLDNKVEVRIGPVFSYLLHATEIKGEYIGFNSLSEYKDSSKDNFNEFQVGATIQTTYRVGQKIGVDFTAQKFFTPIYKSGYQAGGEAKYNVLSLGLSYHL